MSDSFAIALATTPAGTATRGSDREGRGRLAEIQRARIVAAMLDLVGERGLAETSVTRVVARSGVSRRTFYEHFEDLEACFLVAFEDSLERLTAAVVPAYAAPGAWPARLRAAIAALLDAVAAERSAGRLAVVEALGAGNRALERRRRALALVAAAIDADGSCAARGAQPPPVAGEGMVGGALALIHERLIDPSEPPVADLLGPLTAMIVLPYLGPAAARRELERPVAPGPAVTPRRPTDPLRDLQMRLTYRTLRVLLAVGDLAERGQNGAGRTVHPSNRAVADAAGIRDQGQISKLLARLQQLGLVRNDAGLVRGEPNAWTLTERGDRVRATLAR